MSMVKFSRCFLCFWGLYLKIALGLPWIVSYWLRPLIQCLRYLSCPSVFGLSLTTTMKISNFSNPKKILWLRERFFWRKKLFRLKWCHEHPLSAYNNYCMLFGTVTLWMICYLHFSFFQEKATNKAASSSDLGDKKGNKCYLGYPWLNLWATYPPRMKDLMIEWVKKKKLKSVLEYYNVVRWFFFSLSVMHCKQHKLSRWANVVINIVDMKKKLQ